MAEFDYAVDEAQSRMARLEGENQQFRVQSTQQHQQFQQLNQQNQNLANEANLWRENETRQGPPPPYYPPPPPSASTLTFLNPLVS